MSEAMPTSNGGGVEKKSQRTMFVEGVPVPTGQFAKNTLEFLAEGRIDAEEARRRLHEYMDGLLETFEQTK